MGFLCSLLASVAFRQLKLHIQQTYGVSFEVVDSYQQGIQLVFTYHAVECPTKVWVVKWAFELLAVVKLE